MKGRRLALTIIVLIGIVAGAAAISGVFTPQTGDTPDQTPTPTVATDTALPTKTETIVTGQSGTVQDEQMLFGLLPLWQAAYNGTGAHDYDFDGDGTPTTQQCGNCHLGGGSKHDPPLHPIGLSPSDTGNWFFDDDRQIGPNTRLVSQPAGITPKGLSANCGDCHTPTNPSGFANPDNSGRTSDPHSVHRDVIGREGCIRCHSGGGAETFSGTVTFTQTGAGRNTNGIANPINMTRVWDGKFLSAPTEAKYGPDGENDSGNGWNKYKSPDSDGAVAQGCGDCHSQYHKNGGLGFTFDDSINSRKGPIAMVNYDESIGINSGGNVFVCGDCHVTDAHAVHTNGQLNSRATYNQLENINATLTNPGAQGAEYCPECHGQQIAKDRGGHFSPEAADLLGLKGPRNAEPDALSSNYGPRDGSGDCGFCHK